MEHGAQSVKPKVKAKPWRQDQITTSPLLRRTGV